MNQPKNKIGHFLFGINWHFTHPSVDITVLSYVRVIHGKINDLPKFKNIVGLYFTRCIGTKMAIKLLQNKIDK